MWGKVCASICPVAEPAGNELAASPPQREGHLKPRYAQLLHAYPGKNSCAELIKDFHRRGET